ncbi:hypothetical protein E3P96_00533 [Wallemia ichthyophaga]|nr:hypothetical protein E3P96_00533 [Wallemia ichthyophaga]
MTNRRRSLSNENILIHQFHGSSEINKEYKLSDKIGEGTFGVVFKATSRSTSNQVAIKKILVHTAKDGFPTTSIREITFLKLLNHSNIVELVDMTYGEENSSPMFYMVFPYMDHDLTGLLERPDFKPPASQIKLYMQQLCQGTAFIHSNGVLHRDMKASNILISNDGSLKIADFGLARICHKLQRNLTSNKSRNYTNMVVTRFYRPPELILGEKNSWGDYGPEIDIWGVGCIFAEMFTHKPILQGQTDIDQLRRIFELCGDPTPSSWPGWESIKGQYDIDIKTSGFKGGNLRSKFTQLTSSDQSTLNLLENMLTMDPKKRISARDALNHNYFWSKPLPMDKNDVKPLPSSHEYDTRKQHPQHDKARPMQPQLPHIQSKPRTNPYAPPNQQSFGQFSSRPAPAYKVPQQVITGSMFSGKPPPPLNFRGAPALRGRSQNNAPHPRVQSNPYVRTASNQSRFSNNDNFKRAPPRQAKQDNFPDDDAMDYGEPEPPSDRTNERSKQEPSMGNNPLPPKPHESLRRDNHNTEEPKAQKTVQSKLPHPRTTLSTQSDDCEIIKSKSHDPWSANQTNSQWNEAVEGRQSPSWNDQSTWNTPRTSQQDQTDWSKSIKEKTGDNTISPDDGDDNNKLSSRNKSTNNSYNDKQMGSFHGQKRDRRPSDYNNDRYSGRSMDYKDRYSNRQHNGRDYYNKKPYFQDFYDSRESDGRDGFGRNPHNPYKPTTKPYKPWRYDEPNDESLSNNKYTRPNDTNRQEHRKH